MSQVKKNIGFVSVYALHQAVMIIPYYRESNPRFTEMAVNTVGEVLKN